MSDSNLTETEDYDKSAVPTAHKTSHQDTGSDEISVAGLSGVLADKQDADKIQGFNVDAAQAAHDGKALTYDPAGSKYEHTTPSGVTDHGELTGLEDDDHPNLHNDARGDARYVKISNILSNFVFGDMYRSIINGTWQYWNSVDQAYQLVFFNNSKALNDELDFDIFAETGNKVLHVLHVTGTDAAIASFYLDDVFQDTIDFYTAGPLYNQTYYIGLNVVGTGLHSLRVKATSKSQSSSAYAIYLTHLRIK